MEKLYMREPTQSDESSRNTSMEIKYGKLEIVQLWIVESTLAGKPPGIKKGCSPL